MNHIAQLGRLVAQQQKQAFDLSQAGQQAGQFAGQMANKGLQSPLGQGFLNVGANAYNQLPQGARDAISGQAMQWGGLNNQNAGDGSWKMPGFTADPSQGVGVNSQTELRTGTGGGRMPQNAMGTESPYGNTQTPQYDQSYDELTERLSSMTPGHAGSPWSQLARGAMTGQMPTSTFSQGTPVANEFGFGTLNGEDIRDQNVDRLVPQATMDQQYGNQMMPEPSPAQDYPNNPGGGGPHMDYTPGKEIGMYSGNMNPGGGGTQNQLPSAEDQVRSLFGRKPQPSGTMQQLPAPGGPPRGVMQQLPAGPGLQGIIDAFPGAAALGGAAGAIGRKPQPSGMMQQLPAGPGLQGIMDRFPGASEAGRAVGIGRKPQPSFPNPAEMDLSPPDLGLSSGWPPLGGNR